MLSHTCRLALARSLDIAATQELAATPNSNVEFQAGAFSTYLSSTPLRHEEVAVALENESGATSGRRASSSLAVPPFSGMKVLLFVAARSLLSNYSHFAVF